MPNCMFSRGSAYDVSGLSEVHGARFRTYQCSSCAEFIDDAERMFRLRCGHEIHMECAPLYGENRCNGCRVVPGFEVYERPSQRYPPIHVQPEFVRRVPVGQLDSDTCCSFCHGTIVEATRYNFLQCGHRVHEFCQGTRCVLCPPQLLSVPLDFQPTGGDCTICMDPLDTGGSLLLRCGHRFHAACVFRLEGPQKICPVCRNGQAFPEQRVVNDAVHAETQALRMRIEEMQAENSALKAEKVDSVLALGQVTCSAVACLLSVAEMAAMLAKDSEDLLDRLNTAESQRGLVLRRTRAERDGTVCLVHEMDRINRLMAEKIKLME